MAQCWGIASSRRFSQLMGQADLESALALDTRSDSRPGPPEPRKALTPAHLAYLACLQAAGTAWRDKHLVPSHTPAPPRATMAVVGMRASALQALEQFRQEEDDEDLDMEDASEDEDCSDASEVSTTTRRKRPASRSAGGRQQSRTLHRWGGGGQPKPPARCTRRLPWRRRIQHHSQLSARMCSAGRASAGLVWGWRGAGAGPGIRQPVAGSTPHPGPQHDRRVGCWPPAGTAGGLLRSTGCSSS